MILVVAIGSVAALLAGFLLLTVEEKRRGTRVASGARKVLDANSERAMRALLEIDDKRIADIVRRGVEKGLHDGAHALLQTIRFFERVLTKVVRNIRARRSRVIDNREERD